MANGRNWAWRFALLGALGVLATADATAATSRLKDVAVAAKFEGVALSGDATGVVEAVTLGLADRETALPHWRDEIWPFASVTKQVTAVLVMQDVERGRLSLSSRLADLLPEFPKQVAGDITVQMLLQHTSGLANPETGPVDAATKAPLFYLRPKAPARQRVDALSACAQTAAAKPGERFDYNNCDTIVLGAILERLHGKTYAALVETRISRPLGLVTLRTAPRRRPAARDVTGYMGAALAPPFNEATYGAGGALMGTAEDLLTFDRALMGGALLTAPSRATLWSGDPALGYVALGAWSFPAQLRGCAASVDLVERRGGIGGVQVRNVMAPQLGKALVMFTNDGDFEFGEIWQGAGFTYDAVSAAFCGA